MSDPNKDHSFIASLVFKFLSNQLSEDERDELENWISSSDVNRREFESLINREKLHAGYNEYYNIDSKDIWDRIPGRPAVAPMIMPSAAKNSVWKYLVAASIAPVLIIAGWLYFKLDKQKEGKADLTTTQKEIQPGKDRATLTLADGSTIILDDAKNGSLGEQGNTSIDKNQGEIEYHTTATSTPAEVVYNSIRTPRGGQYYVKLSDGTGVWLNAASSIRFPVAFTSTERKVAITGEVYFEVAKNASRPFKVILDDHTGRNAEVEVLGTHFNINSYSEEPTIATTLIEGKVRITSTTSSTNRSQQTTLLPGQQAQILTSGTLNKFSNVDTLAAIAWKHGVFRFGGTKLKTVLRQIERWYDVDVIYKGELTDMDLIGQISRYSDASKVFEVLALSGGLKYTVEGRRIFVFPP